MLGTQKILNALFQGLNSRQKEVVLQRFGLGGSGKTKTLDAIGKQYGVTRERVRQIEASALGILKKKIEANKDCAEFLSRSSKYLQGLGGVAPEGSLISHLESFVEGLKKNHLALFIEAAEPFYAHEEDNDFYPFYYIDKLSLKKAGDFIALFARSLKTKKAEILAGGYALHLKDFVRHEKSNEKLAENYLSLSKKIHSSNYGDIGLAEWPEINPKTIRDRVYLILKKNGKPLHFQDIATHINKVGLGERKALAPTVHNELIKDSRFVLVGRGVYALREYGYEPGTAREVISRILKKRGPLTLKDVVLAVEKERLFKPNTILANLQNKDLFERMDGGAYRVRQA